KTNRRGQNKPQPNQNEEQKQPAGQVKNGSVSMVPRIEIEPGVHIQLQSNVSERQQKHPGESNLRPINRADPKAPPTPESHAPGHRQQSMRQQWEAGLRRRNPPLRPVRRE